MLKYIFLVAAIVLTCLSQSEVRMCIFSYVFNVYLINISNESYVSSVMTSRTISGAVRWQKMQVYLPESLLRHKHNSVVYGAPYVHHKRSTVTMVIL